MTAESKGRDLFIVDNSGMGYKSDDMTGNTIIKVKIIVEIVEW